MAIEFKDEMFFTEIQSDFILQLRKYLASNIKFSITDIDTNIHKLVRIPRVLINFLIDGFGKDENNESSFINYIQTPYSFIYSSNTDIAELFTINCSRDYATFQFRKQFKDDKKLASSNTLFEAVDIAQNLIYQKLGILLNKKLAFETGMLLTDFINIYMETHGINILKVEKLDVTGNPVVDTDETYEFIYKRNDFGVLDDMSSEEVTEFNKEIWK